jgi:hypothetical protein
VQLAREDGAVGEEVELAVIGGRGERYSRTLGRGSI